MKRLVRTILPVLIVSILVVIGWWLLAGKEVAVFSPEGTIADQQRAILIFTVSLSLIVVIPVFVMLFAFAWKYREGNKKAAYKPEWGENSKLEIVWWGIPILIIMVLGTMTYLTSHSLDPYKKLESKEKTLEVQVVAMQWKWLFIYPEQKVATVNKLPIPVNTPVHFTLTADAPMSAFWVPQLGSQIYAMNAMSSQLNLMATKPGEYKGYNTNINGEGYASMKFTVQATSKTEFDAWTKKAYGSPDMMSEAEYKKLAKPGTIKTPREYMLMDKDLYNTIMMKYMGHGHSEGKRDSEPVELTPDPEKSEHTHHTEGH